MKTSITLLFSLLWVSLASSLSVQAQSLEWQKLNAEVTALYEKGQYDEAVMMAKKALDVAEKEEIPDLPSIATSLNNLAMLYYTQRQYTHAEPLYQRVLAIREKALGLDHPDVAEGLNNLAGIYYLQGQYAQAKPLLQRALAIQEKALGQAPEQEASSLNNLALLYNAQSQYSKAEPLFQRVLAIREKALGPDHPDVAEGLNNLAGIYYLQGQYAQAEPFFQRALGIQEKALGPDHPDVATSLNNLAALYNAQGQYPKAESLNQRALAIREKSLGPDHPDVAGSLNNLAALYETQGQYIQAEPLFQRALGIQEKALGPDHPDVAASLNNLAKLYHIQGQYARAEPLFLRALEIGEKTLGPDHPIVGTSLNNLATLYQDQGQYTRAEPLLKGALAIREKSLGPDHPDVAGSLNNLAALYETQGQYIQAEPLFQRALGIQEKALGPDHPVVAGSLNNLAELYRNQGQHAQAEPLHQRALSIRKKALGPAHPDVAGSLNNLALLYHELGQYARAEPLFQRALGIQEKALGPDHPDVAGSLSNLAGSFWARGDTVRAVELFERSTAIGEHHLRLLLAKGSEYEKRAYMATMSGDTYSTISLHLTAGGRTPDAARLALTTLLQRKGRVLDALADSFSDLRRRLSVEDVALLDQLASVNGQRAALYRRASQARIAPEQYTSQMAGLEVEAQELEARISASSAEFRALAQPITLERVQQAIPAGAALVEFSVYRPFNSRAKTPRERWSSARYIAYVLRPQGEPVAVDLGEAAAVERMVGDLGRALANPGTSFVLRMARKLDEQVMRPVRKLLGETRTVLLSPDGALNLVPFGALVDEDNQYLIERHAFTYLSSGRDLLRFLARVPSRYPGTIMADVDFGSTEKAMQVAQAGPGSANRRSTASGDEKFLPLPGSAAEAVAIAKIFPAVKVLTGKQATESALKQLDGPQILHLATHGFFLPIVREEPMEERALQSSSGGPIHAPKTENPLLRSGLALANANRLESGDEDGVLTALEAASLDLWGTQLVVLSACETGVGEVRNGEGVFGLRRALVIAGSESQVMSLWSVGDLATKDLMVDYYRRLLAAQGRSEALRQAQLAMLTSKNYKHPYYWAGFIPSGNWTGLESKVPTGPVQ